VFGRHSFILFTKLGGTLLYIIYKAGVEAAMPDVHYIVVVGVGWF
jgi:hypothetical protein